MKSIIISAALALSIASSAALAANPEACKDVSDFATKVAERRDQGIGEEYILASIGRQDVPAALKSAQKKVASDIYNSDAMKVLDPEVVGLSYFMACIAN